MENEHDDQNELCECEWSVCENVGGFGVEWKVYGVTEDENVHFVENEMVLVY